ncbi:MAG: hypothetical protein JNM56_00560 [Planctomycetia bacterium]|nr:hypothetical protein [Planctomycetia bacterium]
MTEPIATGCGMVQAVSLSGEFSIANQRCYMVQFTAESGGLMQHDITLPQLGRLQWDESAGHWRGELGLQRAPVPLEIVPVGAHTARPDAAEVFAAALRTTDWVRANERQALLMIATPLSESYNRQAADDQEPVTVEQFADWIEIASVRAASNGFFDLILGDCGTNLFAGVTALGNFDAEFRLTCTFVSKNE